MSIFNSAVCATTYNTAGGTCGFDPDVVMGAILIPKGATIQASDMATPQTFLQGKLANDTRTSRWFMIGKLGNLKDNSTDASTQDLDDFKTTTSDGKYDWQWQLISGPMNNKCGHISLLNFSLTQNIYDILLFDAAYNLIGTNRGTAAVPLLGGFALHEIYVNKWKLRTVKTINEYMVNIRLEDWREANQNFLSVNLAFNPLISLKGLQDVVLTVTGTGVTQTVTGSVGCGATDLATNYAALAAPGAWVVKNLTAGTSITPSAVTVGAAGNTFVFTIPSSGQTTGDKLQFALAAPSVTSASPYNYKYLVTEPMNYGIGTY